MNGKREWIKIWIPCGPIYNYENFAFSAGSIYYMWKLWCFLLKQENLHHTNLMMQRLIQWIICSFKTNQFKCIVIYREFCSNDFVPLSIPYNSCIFWSFYIFDV